MLVLPLLLLLYEGHTVMGCAVVQVYGLGAINLFWVLVSSSSSSSSSSGSSISVSINNSCTIVVGELLLLSINC